MARRLIIALSLSVTALANAPAFASFGRTVGVPGVSPIGSAQYSIPIWTPPGIGKVVPHLALTYDSNRGYGIMGPGWAISGLSSISRCNRTYAQDGAPAPITLTNSDAFCLDGNRLRLTSSENLSTYGEPGTTYQTETANFDNVTVYGTAGTGPSYFVAQDRHGFSYEYGNTTDSKVLVPGSATVDVWALDKVTDTNGNQMIFTYTQTNGSYVPSTIQYSAASGSSSYPYQVQFLYKTFPLIDQQISVVNGYQIMQSAVLSAIVVTSGGTIVRKYRLGYSSSTNTLRYTLSNVTECGGSAGGDCLPATFVGYQSGVAGIASPTLATGGAASYGSALVPPVYSVDINGDGRDDLVYCVGSGTSCQWWVQLATATGYSAPINSGATTTGANELLLDNFDGSGKTEIMAPAGGQWSVYKYNGTAFSVTSTGIGVNASDYYASADVDGDGLPDLVEVSGWSPWTISVYSNSGKGNAFTFAAPVTTPLNLPITAQINALYGNNMLPNSPRKHFDFDGDGRDDLVLYYQRPIPHGLSADPFVTLLSRGTGPFVVGSVIGTTGPDTGAIEVVKWNDDNCDDVVRDMTVFISACNGGTAATLALPAAATLAVDWDGDGRTDVLANVGGYWTVYMSQATNFATLQTNIPVGVGTWIVTDKNGDGLNDLVFANGAANGALYYGLHNGAGIRPDLANSFTDGYGNRFSPSYVSIAQSSYTNMTDAVFPYENYVGPLYVVNQAIYSDPSNMPSGTYNQQFLYWGLWKNLQGRGLQAFQSIRKQDSRNGLFDFYYYDRGFPTTGLLNRHDYLQANAKTEISYTSNTTASETLDGTAYNERYFPYVQNSTVDTYEVSSSPSENGQPVTQTVTQYGSPDAYGNFPLVTSTVTDVDSGSQTYGGQTYGKQWVTTTNTTVTPDTTTWCLDLPTEVTVTKSNTTSDGAAITNTVKYNSPDYSHCRQTDMVIDPGSSYQATVTYGYDGFGNLATQTMTGLNMAPRVTSLYWGTTGQFLTTVTNPLSQITTFTHDPNSGMLTSEQDPNGIKTSWNYDDFARVTEESRPDGTSITWAYNSCGAAGCFNSNNLMTVTKAILNVGGQVQTVENRYLDSLDRVLMDSKELLGGGFDHRAVKYDSLGNVVKADAPCVFGACTEYWTTNTYDALNRLVESQRPISQTDATLEATNYQYLGRTMLSTDPLGNTTTRITLVTGKLAHVQGANGYYENFYYDPLGSLLRITDSRNPANLLYQASYAYGFGAFRTFSYDMDLGNRTYTVDALGEVTAYTDAKGQSFGMQYDALSRPHIRTEPDYPSGTETTTWNWGTSAAGDNIGQLQSITKAASYGTYTAAYTYDAVGRPSTEILSLPGDTSYTYTKTYDATTGLLATLQYPQSTAGYQLKLQYGYAHGILQSISDYNAPSTVFWTADTANPRGQVTNTTLGNGVVENRVFDAVTGWLDSLQAGVGGGSALQNNSYLPDENGNLVQRQDNNRGLTENAFYDNMNQLSHSTLNGQTNLSMTYDDMGNITSRSDVAAGAAWTYDPVHRHQVTQAGSSANQYVYDANGNVSSRDGYLLTWTSYNYPSGINSSGESILFSYDPFRARWRTVYSGSGGAETTYNAGRLLEKVVGGGIADYRHYIFAGNELVAIYNRSSNGTNTLNYVLNDSQGSIANILTSSGTSVVGESFTAFGNRRSAATWSGAPTSGDETAINAASRWGFTGQTVLGVSMGLVDLNGRVVDTNIGRFLSADPNVSNPSDPQNYNRYTYVGNNPMTLVDPSGFGACDAPNSPGSCDGGADGGTLPAVYGYGTRIYDTSSFSGASITQSGGDPYGNDGPANNRLAAVYVIAHPDVQPPKVNPLIVDFSYLEQLISLESMMLAQSQNENTACVSMVMRAAQGAAGLAQVLAGGAQAIAGAGEFAFDVFLAPESGTGSLLLISGAVLDITVGVTGAFDGANVLRAAINGNAYPQSLLGQIGQTYGGEYGGLAGETANLTATAVALASGRTPARNVNLGVALLQFAASVGCGTKY